MALVAASAISNIAMHAEDREPPPPPYAGSYAVIRPEGPFYIVTIEPRLPCGAGEPLTYASKTGAWDQMLAWCRDYGLPPLNLCDGKAGPRSSE